MIAIIATLIFTVLLSIFLQGNDQLGGMTIKASQEECSYGWKCKDSAHLAYQGMDCKWTAERYCKDGCKYGACQTVKDSKCIQGWKCKDSKNKAFQAVDCRWGTSYFCISGCLDGACKPNTAFKG